MSAIVKQGASASWAQANGKASASLRTQHGHVAERPGNLLLLPPAEVFRARFWRALFFQVTDLESLQVEGL